MSKPGTSFFRIVATAAMLMAGAGAASAATLVDFSNPAFAPVAGPTSVPIGHAQFCKAHRNECRANAHVSALAELTEARWQQLVGVNNRMNTEIVPITDEDLYKVGELWTYPEGFGDCEDIALAKRKALIEDGWDASTLLMTVVRERNGNGHAVLMVRTDRGDLVLDNQESLVKVWSDTPYQFVKRQAQDNAGHWVSIEDSRTAAPVITAATTKR
ncbi:MAG TPA: transglutaminase-like cysteine peptidase [Devosia sp.]|nr:transglutaminase-like cysteine peptidase [Devosia sp.]